MFNDPEGPVEHFSWGRFVVLGEEHSGSGESRVGKGKDLLIVGTTVKRWKEREGHRLDWPMVKRVLQEDVRVLVIGNGVEGALAVPREVVSTLLEKGIEKVFVEKTPEACSLYNRLYRGGEKKIAMLVHGTC